MNLLFITLELCILFVVFILCIVLKNTFNLSFMKIFLICVLGLFLGYILFYEVFEWQYRNGIRKIDINEERKEMIVEAYPIEIDVEDWTFCDFPNHLNEKNKTNGISIFNGKEKWFKEDEVNVQICVSSNTAYIENYPMQTYMASLVDEINITYKQEVFIFQLMRLNEEKNMYNPLIIVEFENDNFYYKMRFICETNTYSMEEKKIRQNELDRYLKYIDSIVDLE